MPRPASPHELGHPPVRLPAHAYEPAGPVTGNAGIGTDVPDQHPSSDGPATGGVSGRDFIISAERVRSFTSGGMCITVGCAVTAPEVLLKAVSMVAGAGHRPGILTTTDFDIRPAKPQDMTDESSPFYYWRDQKSIVTRIPQAFDGRGYYIEGNQNITFPVFYQSLIERLS